jgi:hypothetical protein
VYVPATSVAWYVPDDLSPELAGIVPGAVSHATLCVPEAHENVTVPAGMVSGVGEKE